MAVSFVFTVALTMAGAVMHGRKGAFFGLAVALAGWAWLQLGLPRQAARQFGRGEFVAAARRYRALAWISFSSSRRLAARLSIIGCAVASGKYEVALAALETLSPDSLTGDARAVWLNNRACTALWGTSPDATAALAFAEDAWRLRPDVAGIGHTRAAALLRVGRLDEAIAVLDQLHGAADISSRLEAERCRDLAEAWSQKGEHAYAADYRARAARLGIASVPPAATP